MFSQSVHSSDVNATSFVISVPQINAGAAAVVDVNWSNTKMPYSISFRDTTSGYPLICGNFWFDSSNLLKVQVRNLSTGTFTARNVFLDMVYKD